SASTRSPSIAPSMIVKPFSAISATCVAVSMAAHSDKNGDMSIYDVPINTLEGETADLHNYEDKTVLLVNVASKCGLTPQYTGLERIHERYKDRGFTVLGVPCNQFGGQEPGSPEDIQSFCSTTYGVTFPLTEKIEVNGDGRHDLYQQLVDVAD